MRRAGIAILALSASLATGSPTHAYSRLVFRDGASPVDPARIPVILPEPASAAALIVGLTIVIVFRHRRRNK